MAIMRTAVGILIGGGVFWLVLHLAWAIGHRLSGPLEPDNTTSDSRNTARRWSRRALELRNLGITIGSAACFAFLQHLSPSSAALAVGWGGIVELYPSIYFIGRSYGEATFSLDMMRGLGLFFGGLAAAAVTYFVGH